MAIDAFHHSRGCQGIVAAVTIVATVVTMAKGHDRTLPWLQRAYFGASAATLSGMCLVGIFAVVLALPECARVLSSAKQCGCIAAGCLWLKVTHRVAAQLRRRHPDPW